MPSPFDQSFAGFLFDMDGTIVDSTVSAERVWGRWAAKHGLDVGAFLPKMHGSRTIDTLRRLNLPNVDPEREAALIEGEESDDVADVVAIPGARAFLESLPARRWALVTSSSKTLVLRRLEAAQLPKPELLVTADEVQMGKPDPQAYLLGAEKLGVNARDCLVFEDTIPGMKAGESTGASVIMIDAVHNPPLKTDHESISDYREIGLVDPEKGRLRLARK